MLFLFKVEVLDLWLNLIEILVYGLIRIKYMNYVVIYFIG